MEQRYLVREVTRTRHEIGPVVAGGVLWLICFAALVKGGVVSSQFTGVVIVVVVLSWFLFGAISYVSCKINPRHNSRVSSAQDSESQSNFQTSEVEIIEEGRLSNSRLQLIRGIISNSRSRMQVITGCASADRNEVNPPAYKDVDFSSVVEIGSDTDMTSSNSSSDTPPPVYDEAIKLKQ